MSYQLIYTSAEELLDPGLTGYGVVARSVGMPPLLRGKLISLSDVSEAEETAEIDAWFTYRICTCGEDAFHVLSRYCWAGADYSGRKRSLAHHLALTADEVAALKRNAARPTPAGIMLALRKNHFWVEEWAGPPRELEGEPRLSASSLPDATGQVTWKAYTGHKNNARAFFTPPYDGICLVEAPPDASLSDVLLLLNESDWLSTSRGWGKTFSTHADRGSDPRETERLIFPAHSAPERQKGRFAGLPLLIIDSQMNLPRPPDAASESSSFQRKQENAPLSAPPLPLVSLPASSSHLPYKYCERPDEETYQLPPRRRPFYFFLSALTGILLLAGGGLFLFPSLKGSDDASHASSVSVTQAEDEAWELLQGLLHAPYSAAGTTRQLDKIQAKLKDRPRLPGKKGLRQDELRECVSILQHASAEDSGHAGNLFHLRECAGTLSLDARALCELYMREVLHDRSLEEWQSSLSEEEYQGWASLLEQVPDMEKWLLQESFLPYMAGIVTRASLHLVEGVTSPGPSSLQEEVSPPHLAEATPSVSMQEEAPLMVGSPLPTYVQKALAEAPLTVQAGVCELFILPTEKRQLRRYSVDLGEKGRQISLLPNGKESYVLQSNDSSEMPPVTIRLHDGVLRELSSGGKPVCLRFSLLLAPGRGVTLTLLSPWQMTLHPMGEGAPPATDRVDFSLSPDRLVLCPSSDATHLPSLQLKPGKNFPWTPLLSELQLRPSPTLLYLPILSGANQPLPVQEKSPQAPYCWRVESAPTHSSPTADAYICHMQRVYDYSRPLMECFQRVANTACCGEEPEEDSFFSLASAYALVTLLEEHQLSPSRREYLQKQYIHLFTHPVFAQQLADMLRGEPQLLLTPHQAAEGSKAARQQRHRVREALALPEKRHFLLRRIREVLSSALAKTYEKERRHLPPAGAGDMNLRLHHLDRTPQGELLWFFSLQPIEHS